MKKESIEEFLKRGGKIEKVKPGAAAVLGSLDKSKIPHYDNDDIIVMTKSTGTLILDALLPGERLFLFSTGTGFAPFASLIRDPETYDKFKASTCDSLEELVDCCDFIFLSL